MELNGDYSNEFEAAYELSRIGLPADDRAEIARLLATGHYIVTASHPVYCKFTDALIGERVTLVSFHATRVDADSMGAHYADMWGTDSDLRVDVLPRVLVAPARPLDPTDSEEIPF